MNGGMNAHPARFPSPPLTLTDPLPAATAGDWLCWGQLAGQADLLQQWPPSANSLVLLTADDTESRLLADVAGPKLIPFADTPWILGGAISPSLVTSNGTWLDALVRVEVVHWLEHIQRPVVVPRPALVPTWQTATPSFRNLVRATLPRSVTSEVTAVEAGWLQFVDDLDASHQCSQSIEGAGRHQSGDYWHAIMHRREPDYANSQYWFRQFGRHPVYERLSTEAERVAVIHPSRTFSQWLPRLIVSGRWDPLAFVNCCRDAAASSEAEFVAAVAELQYREMLLLLGQSLQDSRV